MLEADALQRVGELDVDAEVVRVELELVVGRPQAASSLTSIASVATRRRWSIPMLVLVGASFENTAGVWPSLLHDASLPQFKRSFKS
jgi:hypothetical protein